MWPRESKMKKLIITFAFLALSFIAAESKESSCINCHVSSDWVSDTTIAVNFMSGDIHRNMGLGCVDCHGGDPKHGFAEGDADLAMNPAKGYKSPPSRFKVPEFCAGCHSDIEYMKKYNPKLSTDQLKLYKTSVHGKKLYAKRDTKVAVCTDCHGVHGMLPASDSRSKIYHNNIPETCRECHSDEEYMKGYKYLGRQIPTDQYDEYAKSVHGVMVLEKGDNSAPACNNCHGNHGATPPNIASVSAACGECHANNRDFFNNSPHKKPWEEMGYPECEQCHDNHYIKPTFDEMIGINNVAVCVECHDDDSEGYRVASAMRSSIDSLKLAIFETETIIKKAEHKGVEGGQAGFDLGAAKDNLTMVRSTIHTFNLEKVTEITTSGIKTANEVKTVAEAALGDISTRQIGLAVSLLVVIFVAFMLWLKIKQVDRNTEFEVKE